MKINLILLLIFATFTLYAYSSFEKMLRINGTQLNDNGFGCACHSIEPAENVLVWVEGPDTLFAGEEGFYKMFLAGGPAIAGGYNVAAKFGLLGLIDSLSLLIDNELTQNYPLIFPSIYDTISWPFSYIAPDSAIELDTIYSTGLSVNYDLIPSDEDLWNYGPKFTVTIMQPAVPVELVSFTSEIINNDVHLSWGTAAEMNNYGFEVERKNGTDWKRIGFVIGSGTTTEKKMYSFIDKNSETGIYKYRLKQIDHDGRFEYSNEVEAEINSVKSFALYQNYPNPFNPTTKIKYSIQSTQTRLLGGARGGLVTLKVFDILGNEVSTLVNETKSPGEYEVELNAKNLASGLYFYQLKAGDFSSTKKMLLMK